MNKINKIVFGAIVVIGLFFIIVYSLYNNKEQMKIINNILDVTLKSETEVMLYVGSSDCEACDYQATQMQLLFSNYDLKCYYIDFNEITTSSAKEKFIKRLNLEDSTSLSTPSILIYKNGEVQSHLSGLTSINKIFNVLQKNNIISSEEKLPINYLSLSSYIELLEDDDTHVLMISSVTDSDSNSAQEIIWDIAKEYDISINYLNLSDLTEVEGATFESKLDYYSTEGNSVIVPTMLIIKDGKVINSLEQLQTSEVYIDFLTENDIIEEEV